MLRLRSTVCTASVIVLMALPAASQTRDVRRTATAEATCDARSIDPDSYALTTRAQARIANEDRSGPWWERFSVDEAARDLYDLNSSSTYAAERARTLDSHNLMAHGLLARQYVVLGEDASLADTEWQTVLDNGGAIVWTATLYDVDAKSFFVMAFDR